MKCIVCNEMFDAKRADARYCSDKCRKSDKRQELNRTNVRDNPDGVRDNVRDNVTDKLPDNYGRPDCQCRHCLNVRSSGSKLILNHGQHKSSSELAVNELNRVALPGDTDYRGVMSA